MKLTTTLVAVKSEKLISTDIILFIIPPVMTIVTVIPSFSSPLKLSDANWILSTAEKYKQCVICSIVEKLMKAHVKDLKLYCYYMSEMSKCNTDILFKSVQIQ